MPCLNEAETIEVCVRKAAAFLADNKVAGEILIADNGSTDGSQHLAQKLGARIVNITQRGYGAALIGGIEAAAGRYVIMADADDSYDFSALSPFLAELRAGQDLVMGNRFKGGIRPGAMPPLHRYLGNPVLSAIGRMFFSIPIGDFHCGLRGFSRAAIRGLGLSNSGMEFASEMVVKASLRRLKISEVPTVLSPDGRSRPPHLRSWRDGWRHLRFLLLHSPRWLFLYPGLVFVVLGLTVTVVLLAGPVQLAPHIAIDVHSLVAACFATIIGSQLVMFSALARKYAMTEGFLPPAETFTGVLRDLTLERLTQVGALLFVLGLIGSGWALERWAVNGFGPILYNGIMRVLVTSLTAIVIAVQMVAGAFLGSIFEIRHVLPAERAGERP